MQILLIQTILKDLKKRADTFKRIGLILLALFFFLANYQICNYFYPLDDDVSIDNWWLLKVDIYALIIAILFILASHKKTSDARVRIIEKLIVNVGIAFAASNFIDRRLLGERDYHETDLLMIIVVFLVSYYDFKKLKKIAKTQTNEQ